MFGLSWLTGKLVGYGAAALALLGVVGKIFLTGRKSGEDAMKAKEAEARDKNLKRIHDASNAKPTGGVHNDPNNRANRR